MQHGEVKLAQVCGIIASDEKRHETAYTKIVEKLFEHDPNEMVIALANMMKRKISMPAHLMYDGHDHNLFDHFAIVASRIGVYTARNYRETVELLVVKWKVGKLTGLTSEGREAQDYVCRLAQRMRRLEEREMSKAQKAPTIPFSWIFGKVVNTVAVPAGMYRTSMYTSIETLTFHTSLNTGHTSHTDQFRAISAGT